MKLKSITCVVMSLVVVNIAGAQEGAAQNDTARPPGADVAAKDAPALPAVTPVEAKKLLEGDEGYIYLDVRTPEEFAAGRPKGAINIPVFFIDTQANTKSLNEAFLDVVAAHIAKDAKVIVGCRSGARSAVAQKILDEAGYKHTVNMLGGFSGKKDSNGEVLVAGWSVLDYPIEKGDAGASGYDELKKKTKP